MIVIPLKTTNLEKEWKYDLMPLSYITVIFSTFMCEHEFIPYVVLLWCSGAQYDCGKCHHKVQILLEGAVGLYTKSHCESYMTA